VRARALLLCALALVATACTVGGDDEGSAAPARTKDVAPARAPNAVRPDPRPGRLLLRFVAAARRADAEAMWSLLSRPTRASIGPTLGQFRLGAAAEFAEGVGTLAPRARVILSGRIGGKWAVAAVSGARVVEGEREDFAYGAAFLQERGGLRLELAGAIVGGHEPGPLEEVDEARPRLAVTVSAGRQVTELLAWLDGALLPIRRQADDLPFTATLDVRPRRPLRPGRHEVVVFAATDRTAIASAWTFVVRG
jgi:hypothetical protein